MREPIRQALERDTLVDITTTGRKSGRGHRVQVGIRLLDGQVYLTNLPGLRDWTANLLANPEFTFHLKQSTQADIKARATHIHDPVLKRDLLSRMLAREDRLDQLETRMQQSYLFRVELLDAD